MTKDDRKIRFGLWYDFRNPPECDASAERARLLASLAQSHSNPARYEPAHEALRGTLNIASVLSDPKLEARLLLQTLRTKPSSIHNYSTEADPWFASAR
jgi:hypothetical protein